MALTQIINRATFGQRVGPVVKRWPAGAEEIRFELDDAQFASGKVTVLMQCSWNNKGAWPFSDMTTWQAGAKAKDGSSPSVILGPFVRDGQVQNPTHVRFFAEPAEGSGAVTVGLKADVSEDN